MKIFETKIHILPQDNETHVNVNFDVPDGLKCLTVRTSYSPK